MTGIEIEIDRKTLLNHIGQTLVRHVKIVCPVDTGRMRNSIRYEIDITTGEVRVIVGTEYAVFVNYSTVYITGRGFLERGIINGLRELGMTNLKFVKG